MSGALEKQYGTSANLEARIQLHERFSVNQYSWFRWLFDRLTISSGSRILELGTGTARLWLENRTRLPEHWKIVLSDLSPGMLEQARRNLAGHVHVFRFKVVDAQDIPFVDVFFDAVIANFMLYHVPDRPRALSEIRRVLKPGGRLFAATIGGDHMRELDSLLTSVDPGSRLAVAASGGFSLEDGHEQLETGFQAVTLDRYEDGLNPVRCLIDRAASPSP